MCRAPPSSIQTNFKQERKKMAGVSLFLCVRNRIRFVAPFNLLPLLLFFVCLARILSMKPWSMTFLCSRICRISRQNSQIHISHSDHLLLIFQLSALTLYSSHYFIIVCRNLHILNKATEEESERQRKEIGINCCALLVPVCLLQNIDTVQAQAHPPRPVVVHRYKIQTKTSKHCVFLFIVCSVCAFPLPKCDCMQKLKNKYFHGAAEIKKFKKKQQQKYRIPFQNSIQCRNDNTFSRSVHCARTQ